MSFGYTRGFESCSHRNAPKRPETLLLHQLVDGFVPLGFHPSQLGRFLGFAPFSTCWLAESEGMTLINHSSWFPFRPKPGFIEPHSLPVARVGVAFFSFQSPRLEWSNGRSLKTTETRRQDMAQLTAATSPAVGGGPSPTDSGDCGVQETARQFVERPMPGFTENSIPQNPRGVKPRCF